MFCCFVAIFRQTGHNFSGTPCTLQTLIETAVNRLVNRVVIRAVYVMLYFLIKALTCEAMNFAHHALVFKSSAVIFRQHLHSFLHLSPLSLLFYQ